MSDGLLKVLIGQRESAWAQLKELAPDLTRTIEVLDRSIKDLSPLHDSSDQYAKYKTAIEAIRDLLNEHGKPMPAAKIVEEVLSRGWRKGDKRRRTSAYDSIRFYIKRPSTETLRLFGAAKVDAAFLKKWDVVESEYPIGLWEWPDKK
jgi:hypothetical protein